MPMNEGFKSDFDVVTDITQSNCLLFDNMSPDISDYLLFVMVTPKVWQPCVIQAFVE